MGVSEAIAFVFGMALVALPAAIAVLLYKLKRSYREEGDEWGTWTWVLHKQFILPLRAEERAEWDTMAESERDRHVQNMRVRMMKSEVFYAMTEGKLVLVSRADAGKLGIYEPKKKHNATHKTHKRQATRQAD